MWEVIQHAKIRTRLDVVFIVRLLSCFCTTKQKVSPECKEAVVFLWTYYFLMFMCLRTGILLWNRTVGKCCPPLGPGAGSHRSFIFAFQSVNHTIRKYVPFRPQMIISYTLIQHRAEGGFCKHACFCFSEPWEYHVFQHPLRLFLLLFFLSPLCRVFTIIYLKRTTFLGYRLLFSSCSVVTMYGTCNGISRIECFVLLH